MPDAVAYWGLSDPYRPEEVPVSTIESSAQPAESPRPRRLTEMRLEVVVLPVSDVDRSLAFYRGLGWRLDADFSTARTSGWSS